MIDFDLIEFDQRFGLCGSAGSHELSFISLHCSGEKKGAKQAPEGEPMFDRDELGTLESCPHCGDCRQSMRVDRSGRIYRIACRSCKASGPVSLTPQGAVGLWNMRRVDGGGPPRRPKRAT